MAAKVLTIPANGECACMCCHRVHRKLELIDGYWLGSTCAEAYGFYKCEPAITSSYWVGYERQHAQICRMVGGVTEGQVLHRIA